jgi:histone H3/H4
MIPWIKWDKAVHKPKKVRGWVGTVAELVDEKVMDLAEHEKRSTITTCDQIKAGYGFYVAND